MYGNALQLKLYMFKQTIYGKTDNFKILLSFKELNLLDQDCKRIVASGFVERKGETEKKIVVRSCRPHKKM